VADAIYPLMRRRGRRWRLPRPGVRARTLALVAVLGLALVATARLATRRGPVDAAATLGAARSNLARGNYSAARNNARAALAAGPETAAAHLLLARAYLALEQAGAAAGEIDRASALGSRAPALLADARLLGGDVRGAVAAAAEADGRDRGHADRIAARAAAADGRTAQAQAMLLALLGRAPRDMAAWTDLGRIRLVSGEIGGAAEAAANAVRLAPAEPAALTLQGEVVRSRFGLAAALPWFRRALATDAYYPPALIEAAATAGDMGRHAEMLALTRQALAARPDDPRARYLQAVLAVRAGDDDLARRLLRRAGDGIATLPGARLLDGALDYRRGQYSQAAVKWADLAAAQPLNVQVRRLLAAALIRAGDPRAALNAIRAVAVRSDADSYALEVAARGAAGIGEGDVAARFSDRAAVPRGVSAVFASDAAIAALRAGARSAPDDPSYALGVIRGQVGARDLLGALATARALAGAAPGAPAAQTALGDALALAGRWSDAATAYARAADLRFDEPAMLRLLDAQGRLGRRRDAAATLALFLQQNPRNVSARRILAGWQLDAGKSAAAIETLEGLRRTLGNRDADLLARLALAYAAADDPAVALRYARAAYALQPMSARVTDAYGIALAADGQVDEARQLFAKAVRLAPADPVIADHRRRLG